ncbi:MAG: T9SS type A sorting domain-containing protein, partial [Tunicatimonas sp.]|uniref:Ig-like domain-containing protein n=1 Tax=Tunicatimonas sp. TaxID=1940096 RepID=UPI003C73E1A3
DNPTVEIPVQLTVTGTPELNVSSRRAQFGEVYRTFSKKRELVAKNKGTDTLTINNIVSDNELFTVESVNIMIAPGEKYTFQVVFSPQDLSEQAGQITISSNDLQQPEMAVLLDGIGLEPPPLLISPSEIVAEVVQSDSLTRGVRLQNTSFTDTLRWSVDEVLPSWLTMIDSAGSLLPREVGRFRFKLKSGNEELGQYRTNIRFQFFDDELEVLPITMVVVEPNLPPIWSDSLVNFSIAIKRGEARFNVASFVTDPEGDPLRFSFQWKGNAIASARTMDSILLINPWEIGKSEGIIRVTDAVGNKAEVTSVITILPENQSPQPIQDTLAVAIRLQGESARLNLDSLFSDPDQDSLTYSFTRPSFSSNDLGVLKSSVVDLRIEDKLLIGQANALGEQEAILYAYDPVGEYSSVTLLISVLPPNQAPLVKQQLNTQYLVEYQQWEISLSTIFTDPDGDTLMFQAAVADPDVAQLELTSDSLRITARLVGETEVQLQAQDQAGDFAILTFNLKVDQVTAISSIPADEVFNIYPNPATNWITIDYAGVQAIKIYNTQGLELNTKALLPGDNARFSVASLPSGIYSLVVFTENGKTQRTSFIKE